MFRLSSRINEPATLSSGNECETEFSVEDTIPTFFGSHDAMQEPLQQKVFAETKNKQDDHSSPRKQQQKQSGLDDLLINLTNTSPKRPTISSRDNKVTPKVVATQVVISSKDNYNSATLSPRPCLSTVDKQVREKQKPKSQQQCTSSTRREQEDEAGERPRRRLSLAESLERLPDESPTPSRTFFRPLSPPPRSPSRHHRSSSRHRESWTTTPRQQQDRQQQQRSNKSRGRSRRVHSHQYNSTSLRAQRTLDNTCAQASSSSSPRRRRRSVSERPTRRTNSSHKQQQQQQQSSPFMQQLALLMEEQLQTRKRQQQQQQQRPRQNSTDDRHHSPLRRSSRTPLRRITTTTQPRNRSRSIQRTKLRTLRDTDEFFNC